MGELSKKEKIIINNVQKVMELSGFKLTEKTIDECIGILKLNKSKKSTRKEVNRLIAEHIVQCNKSSS